MAEDGEGVLPSDPAAAVRAMLDRLAPEGALGVAVSGGGDSMALLAMAADWARHRGRELHAVTVDHGLRPESAGEAAFAAAGAARLGVAHRTLGAGAMGPGNLPAAAREARYALMADWARAAGIAGVALGHTMDDQAETLLMRLARGSGVEGLSAMAPRRDWQGVAWIRPMLGVRRAALRAWLRARGLEWVDDPTNEDAAYDRVRARRALAALEPLGITVEGLAGTAAVLARQRRVLARAAAEIERAAVQWGEFGEAWIALGPLHGTERDTALRVFADTLVAVAGGGYRPRFRSLEPALAGLLEGDAGATTLGGCLVVPDREAGSALICREPAAVDGPVPLGPTGAVWDGRWRVIVPPGLSGDWRVGALGRAGRDRLDRAAASGGWQPPAAWAAAPRTVLETVPAIFAGADDAPAAVPAAGFLTAGLPASVARIAVQLVRGAHAQP